MQSIAVNSFLKCRIEPIDRHVFTDYDILLADTEQMRVLAEPEIQQNECDKQNETPDREQSISSAPMLPMLDTLVAKVLQEIPALTS